MHPDEYGPGSILASYLVGEEVWAKEIERGKLERQKASKMKKNEGRMSTMCRIL